MIGICQSCFRSNDKSSSGSSSGSSVVLSNVLVVTAKDTNSSQQGRSGFDPSVTFSVATTVVWYNNNYNILKFKWLYK